MAPRQFLGISELIATLVGILNAASQTQDNDILTRLYDLYDTVLGGLKAHVDKEFFSSKNSNLIPLLNKKLQTLKNKRDQKVGVTKENKESPTEPKPL